MFQQPPTYIVFGPRVSDVAKAAICDKVEAEEIPADFGPFGSGAPFCELFPFLKDERKGKSDEELAERYAQKIAKLKGAHIIFVESTGEQPDVAESVERVRFAVNSFKHYGAAEITLAMPNVAYERQDRGFNEHGRLCSIGTQWLATDLKRYGVDHVVTFAPHSQAGIEFWQQEFGERNYHPLQTTGVFAEHIRKQFPDLSNLVIGAPDGADKPDDQGQARAKQLAAAVYRVDEASADAYLFKIKKDHTSASETECQLISGDVAGKDCVIIDDMSDGGSTLINAAKELKDHGAKSVNVYFTHAICSNNSLHKLATNKSIDHIVTTDTVPEIIGKRDALEPELRDKVEVMSIGHLLTQKLTEISAQLGTHAGRTPKNSSIMRVP